MKYFLMFGVLFFLIGFFLLFFRMLRKKKCTMFVYGKVINYVEKREAERPVIIYYPVFEYVINNETYKDVYQAGTSKKKYNIGDQVELYYNPNNYKEYYVKGNNVTLILSIIFMGIGIFSMVLSYILGLIIK